MAIFQAVYNILWGDLITIPLPGGSSLGISLLVLILIPAGLYFTVRTRFLPFRLFPEMIKVTVENNKKIESEEREGISGVQALIVSTACRVGMGNLVGVVAAISAGGAGAVFWMWVIALVGSSTAFIEATLAQLYKEKDPLYGGYRGGPAYYIHSFMNERRAKRKGSAAGSRKSVLAVLFAISGLICWCGISQVISNSISSSFENAFHVPPIYSTIVLVVIAAVIVLRKNATVKVLDIMVPIMAACYFFITLFIIVKNAGQLPDCVRAHLRRGVRIPSGCGRRDRRGHYERCEAGTLFQRGGFRVRALCGKRRRISAIRQKKDSCRRWAYLSIRCSSAPARP